MYLISKDKVALHLIERQRKGATGEDKDIYPSNNNYDFKVLFQSRHTSLNIKINNLVLWTINGGTATDK